MPLEAQIIEPVTGKVDPVISARLGRDEHGVLFGNPKINPEQFPLLSRMRDYNSDTDYTVGELEALIVEIERAGSLLKSEIKVGNFLGPFHSLCCLAFLRGKDVALYADSEA
jgi:hypothetical protein